MSRQSYLVGMLFLAFLATISWSGPVLAQLPPPDPNQNAVDSSQLNRYRGPRPALRPSLPGTSNPAGPTLTLDVLVMGQDFIKLPEKQRSTVGQTEVILFFHLASPWFWEAWPEFEAWQKTAPGTVRLVLAPAVLDDDWGYGARIFFALEAMDKLELFPSLVAALASGEIQYHQPSSLLRWLKAQGPSVINPRAFQESINSPWVVSRVASIPGMMPAYGVLTVPTIVVDGEYVFAARTDRSPKRLVEQAKFMVEQLEKGGPRP